MMNSPYVPDEFPISTHPTCAHDDVQEVVPTIEDLAKEAQKICDTIVAAAPSAVAASKKLVANVQYKPIDTTLMAYTAEQLATIRMSPESTSGMIAVQAGKKPEWASTPLKFPGLE